MRKSIHRVQISPVFFRLVTTLATFTGDTFTQPHFYLVIKKAIIRNKSHDILYFIHIP